MKPLVFLTKIGPENWSRSGYLTGREKAIRSGNVNEEDRYSWREPGYAIKDEYPVSMIDWHDARAYCRWLSKEDSNYYRLPTLEEWEYVASISVPEGESNEDFGRKVNFADMSYIKWLKEFHGKTLKPEKGWENIDDGFAGVAPVGSLQPDKMGLYDLRGNVFEWVDGEDLSGDSKGEGDELERLWEGEIVEWHVRRPFRGGAYCFSEYDSKNASIASLTGHEVRDYVGFRVLCEIDEDK